MASREAERDGDVDVGKEFAADLNVPIRVNVCLRKNREMNNKVT